MPRHKATRLRRSWNASRSGRRTDEQEAPVPGDDYDARARLYRQIAARRGQAQFCAVLLDAYAGRRDPPPTRLQPFSAKLCRR